MGGWATWIGAVLVAWVVVAIAVALLLGRVVRHRERQVPRSPAPPPVPRPRTPPDAGGPEGPPALLDQPPERRR